MSASVAEHIACPVCGLGIDPVVINNCREILHPADKWLIEKGVPVLPHIDVDYRCPCGFYRHLTLSCYGKKLSQSDSFKVDQTK